SADVARRLPTELVQMVTSRLIALSRRLTQFNLAPQALAWRSADFQPIARWAKGDPRCEHSAPVCRRKRELGLWSPVTGAFDREVGLSRCGRDSLDVAPGRRSERISLIALGRRNSRCSAR